MSSSWLQVWGRPVQPAGPTPVVPVDAGPGYAGCSTRLAFIVSSE